VNKIGKAILDVVLLGTYNSPGFIKHGGMM